MIFRACRWLQRQETWFRAGLAFRIGNLGSRWGQAWRWMMMLACILIWNGMMYSYQYMLPGFFNEHLQVVIRIRTTMIRGGGSRKGDLAQVILALHILDCAAQRIFIAIISAIRDYLIWWNLQFWSMWLWTICYASQKTVFSGACYASRKTVFSGAAICFCHELIISSHRERDQKKTVRYLEHYALWFSVQVRLLHLCVC